MVGEFGSSSPDWWMACLTLSEQDGRCAGCGPQIVTFDCFIRAWFIELSSPWNEVPRRFSRPHLLPVTHPSRDCGPSGRSGNCVPKPGADASTKPDLQLQKAAVKRRSVQMRLAAKPQRSSFLILALMNPWRAGGEAKWTGASGALRCLLRQSCFLCQEGEWFRVRLLSTKVQRVLILICHYEYNDPERAKLSFFFRNNSVKHTLVWLHTHVLYLCFKVVIWLFYLFITALIRDSFRPWRSTLRLDTAGQEGTFRIISLHKQCTAARARG